MGFLFHLVYGYISSLSFLMLVTYDWANLSYKNKCLKLSIDLQNDGTFIGKLNLILFITKETSYCAINFVRDCGMASFRIKLWLQKRFDGHRIEKEHFGHIILL